MPARQTLRFCTSLDGTRIAIASIGSGPPLVRAAHWLSHVEYDLQSPVWRSWLTELSRDHSYVRYDQWLRIVDRTRPIFRSTRGQRSGGSGRLTRPQALSAVRNVTRRCGCDCLCGTPSGTRVALGFCRRVCTRFIAPRRKRGRAARSANVGQPDSGRLGPQSPRFPGSFFSSLPPARHSGATAVVGRTGAGDSERGRSRTHARSLSAN